MAQGQGLYGEMQGNESRSAGRGGNIAIMEDRYRENEICEGDYRQKMEIFVKAGNLALAAKEYERMIADGYAIERAQIALNAAMQSVKTSKLANVH